MATSINGWTVITSYNDFRLGVGRVPGTTVKLRMRRSVLRLFLALAADYHREVAKLRATECGAFNPRHSALSSSWSDHASGTACDLNWGHEGAMGPYGGMKTMTDAQIKACAAIKARYEIVIWGGDKARGGDYRLAKNWDPMHFALKPGTTQEDVDRVIKKLGIDQYGRRAGVKYGVLNAVKALVASTATAPAPTHATTEPAKAPAPAPAKKVVAKKAPAKKAPAATYTVKKGDSLWKIADKHGTTVAALRKLNKLKGDLIVVGQKLKLK